MKKSCSKFPDTSWYLFFFHSYICKWAISNCGICKLISKYPFVITIFCYRFSFVEIFDRHFVVIFWKYKPFFLNNAGCLYISSFYKTWLPLETRVLYFKALKNINKYEFCIFCNQLYKNIKQIVKFIILSLEKRW